MNAAPSVLSAALETGWQLVAVLLMLRLAYLVISYSDRDRKNY